MARIKYATRFYEILRPRQRNRVRDRRPLCFSRSRYYNRQKIYKSNDSVNREFDENWRKEREREKEKRKLSSKLNVRFLLWSRMEEWIVKWLQNGQIRGKIKERGVGGFAETRAGWNIEETRIVCTTGKEAISVTWTSPLVYIRGKGLYRAGFVSGFLLASTIAAIITTRFYTRTRR